MKNQLKPSKKLLSVGEFTRGELGRISKKVVEGRKVELSGVLKNAKEREESVKNFIDRRNRKQYGKG